MRTTLIVTGALLAGLAIGCGGGTAPSPDKPAVGVGTAPSPGPKPAEAPAAAAAPKAAPSAGFTEIDESEGTMYFAADPTEYGSTFAIEGEGKTADHFVATVPAANVDSSVFIASVTPVAPAAAAPAETDSQPTLLNANTTQATGSKLPKGFSAIVEAGTGPGNLPWKIRCDEDNAEMALVPAGPSILGMNDGPQNAGPMVGVMLDAYYIDIREVTSAQYETYRDAMRTSGKRLTAPTRTAKDPLEPVLGVNWGEANNYAKWAQKELPTEAQWEKAARGATGFRAPWGDGVHIWHLPRVPGQIDTVGSFPSDVSPFGVIDLAGNAREWCHDWYAENSFSVLKSGKESTPRNPTGAKHGGAQSLRVVKGAGAGSNWLACERTGVPMTDRPDDVGFRCVLNLKPDSPAAPKTPDFGTPPKTSTKPRENRTERD